MSKVVVLKVGDGSVQTGFPVTLQMGEEGYQTAIEVTGAFPPVPLLLEEYQRWQTAYRSLGNAYRLEAKTGYVTNVSVVGDCHDLAQSFSDRFNQWFQSDAVRPIRETLLEQLDPSEVIRIILQTNSADLKRFPWHLLDFFERYPRAEVALGAVSFAPAGRSPIPGDAIRILAILGHAQGLDIEQDQALLNCLPHADVHFLIEPSYPELNETLWDAQGWDILFFAGHSSSQGRSSFNPASNTASNITTNTASGLEGCIAINPEETLSITQLRYALKTARQRGLGIAIFNSCDGLGLADGLAELNIPEVLVMREPIPDQVAHEFLKSFLAAFARESPLYLAVREARERLQGLEGQFPCATWLPVIFQNPAENPPTWQTLYEERVQKCNVSEPESSRSGPSPSDPRVLQEPWDLPFPLSFKQRTLVALMTSTGVAALLTMVRLLGGLQPLELKAYDWMLTMRPLEQPDRRIVVIETSADDVDASVTLSNEVLYQLLASLDTYQPRLIGLDLYRDFSASPDHNELAQRLGTTENLVSICQSSDTAIAIRGIEPSPDIPFAQIGFSDFLADGDGVLRRHLVAMTPELTSPCQSSYAFSTQLALRYLVVAGYGEPLWTDDGLFKLGDTVLEPIAAQSGAYQSIDAEGYQILLNYRSLSSPKQIVETVPLQQILDRTLPNNALTDKIVLIGRTDNDSGDLWRTPYAPSNQITISVPGVFVHAHMISQMLSTVMDNRPLLQPWPEWGEIMWILLWAWVSGGLLLLPGWDTPSSPKVAKLALGVLGTEIGLWGVTWIMLVQKGVWVPIVPPAIAIALTAIIILRIKPKSK
ncbi:MAG: CHASE2 domain-containing protein [Cyanobacteria bacterium P01_F01_bin.150]